MTQSIVAKGLLDNRSGPPTSVAQPPGYMKNNPDCICGWKMKRVYATVQVKVSGKWRSRHRPIGWCCIDKCGYIELDSMVQDPVYYSRGKALAPNQAEQKAILEKAR